MADSNFLSTLLNYGQSFAQGASNSIAGNVSAPVDGLAWLLRRAGVPMPSNPVGGSDWMNQQGLTPQPQVPLAGMLGEAAGMAGPMVAAAKAPQIAGGLLKMGENAMVPQALNKQAGVYLVAPNKTRPEHLAQVQKEMESLGTPTIRAYWDGEKYIALEGSHRISAAKNLDLTPNINEVNLKQWMSDHDFPDVKQKASTNRLLNYLEYGNHPGSKYVNFEDL